MSNTQELGGRGGGGIAADVAEQWQEDPRRQTYWAVVGRAYWRSWLSRIATAWTLLVVFIAAFVPFLSNSAPFTVIIDNQREWPLFRDLTRVDLVWLAWFSAGIVFLVVYRQTGRKILEVEPLRTARNRWFVG